LGETSYLNSHPNFVRTTARRQLGLEKTIETRGASFCLKGHQKRRESAQVHGMEPYPLYNQKGGGSESQVKSQAKGGEKKTYSVKKGTSILRGNSENKQRSRGPSPWRVFHKPRKTKNGLQKFDQKALGIRGLRLETPKEDWT